ncbi:hypothetical protein N657DRAFT_617291 [Parathielavia appendiculata]|uniref:MARVEL domain-containing protein n=1 Tax=Parathielavia appendiculata TaxID=2587402 RepID=A0AAN6U148_9PEZI|nr:hypothetical protein N657DRAFT_617291 [Parathielavia appendiculata]
MERFVPIAQAVTAVFAVIELGLTSYLVSPWRWGTPSILGFMLFNSLWSLLVLAYLFLTPLYFSRLYHSLAALVIEWITVIFWFAGSITLASYGATSSCAGNNYCGSWQAAIAFGFFLWALFTFFAVVHTMAFLRGNKGHTATGQPTPYAGA